MVHGQHWVRFVTGLIVRWPVCKQGVQALFEQCQASMDPNSIAQLLAHHPYHIDALLAMFELYRCAPFSYTWGSSPMPVEPHHLSNHDQVSWSLSCVGHTGASDLFMGLLQGDRSA